MIDLLLEDDGDLHVTENGDVQIADRVKQDVLVHLRWIKGEWRLGPKLGFPWFEDVLIKNPNLTRIRSDVRTEVLKVEDVTGVEITQVSYDRQKRACTVRFTVETTQGRFQEEAVFHAR